MDKKLFIILACGLIIFLIYTCLYSESNNKINKDQSDEEYEQFEQENNIVLDPYNYYKQYNKSEQFNNKIELFDDVEELNKIDINHIEHFEDRNLKSQSVDRLSLLQRTATYLETEEVSDSDGSPNFAKNNSYLIPNDLNSNSIFSIPFPENTSIELSNFTAENVSDIYHNDNVADLYNNINQDMYKGYKTLKFML